MTTDKHDVLEHNVSTLLETGGDRPTLADASRARIRAALIARHGAAPARSARSPLAWVGVGVAAVAAAALLVGRFAGSGALAPSPEAQLVAGAEIVSEPGARVTALGARRLRVEGAALIDVEPGKGPFVVETAHGRIEVLGTRFLVDGARDRTTAAVVRGEVKLATDAGEVVLHAGEQAVAEPGRAPVRGPAPRLSHLVSWAREARRRAEHDAPAVHHGTLFARDPGVRSHPPWGDEYPLPLARLGLDVVVEDQVARVALDQTFRNPSGQQLEGVYRFAIPPDAALQRLAMYVDGKLTESAVVERMAARRIYEELVYRRIDPALLEWAGNGRLSLRVYPIPAFEDKRLMLAYTESLPRLYGDWTLTIPLPELDQPAGALDVSVRVKGCASCELTSPSHRVEVARQGDDALVTYHRKAETLGDSFVLHVRDPRTTTTIAEARAGADRYLMVRTPSAVTASAERYRPRSWVILDDVSASRSRLELRAQADVVDAFVRELDEQDRVSVVAFDVEARTRLAPTRVLDVDRRALRTALAAEGGVGATDFAAALDAALAQLAGVAPDDAMIVYLGDGVITSGARNLDALRARLAGKARFIGVGIGDGPDTQTLQGLAAATAGYATTIDLADDLGWRTFDLVAALHTARVTGVSARLVDATGQLVPATTYLASPQLADGEEAELVAKLAGDGTPAAVELTGVMNGQPWQRTIALDGKRALDAGYLPRLWAQRHIAARLLAKHDPVAAPPCSSESSVRGKRPVVCPTEAELREQRDEAIRREVVGLGKQYFLLSRHTSLLVLENDAMYAQYGVTKGAGDTWAPYAMPATIPLARYRAATAATVSPDAELVRSPLQLFYNPAELFGEHLGNAARDSATALGTFGLGASRGPSRSLLVIRGGALAPPPGAAGERAVHANEPSSTFTASGDAIGRLASSAEPASSAAPATPQVEQASQDQAFDARDPLRSELASPHTGNKLVIDSSLLLGSRRLTWAATEAGGGWGGYGQPRPIRLVQPADPAFDDLTAFVPALVPDEVDRWRAVLAPGDRGLASTFLIDDHAKAILTEARRRLPSGVYRWGELELAVDDARRLGWRRTTEAGLGETASFDGTTWTRRYAELGLDVARTMTNDDVALSLAILPVWIAEPAHYARWFDVTARGDREVVLSRKVRGKLELALVLRFDDRSRLIAITDGAGAPLVEVSWDTGPAHARLRGDELAVGFTGLPMANAVQWAHRDSAAGIAVVLPAHPAAYWLDARKAESTGSPGWRQATRQLMVALAATQDRAGLWQAYEELRVHGGVALGDLVLAGAGVTWRASDAQVTAAVAPLASQPVARYLLAARRFARSPEAGLAAPPPSDGLVGALAQLRAATASIAAGNGKAAADALVAIGDRAPVLTMIGAISLANQASASDRDVERAWDAASVGDSRNLAQVAAAQALFQRGRYDAGAERIARLVAELDLKAPPPRLEAMAPAFAASRRGVVGWQQVWTTWRDRVLAGTSYDHVMAVLQASAQQTADVTLLLARAAELAGADGDRVLEVAEAAIARGHDGWAEALLRPLLRSRPSHALSQLLARIELDQGRLADALADLEAAQDAEAGDAVDLASVRGELAQIIDVARRLAVQCTGAARARTIERALAWGARWRAIDPGDTEIDVRLGELMLAVGDTKAAWRQLSSTIERDPWSGAGYTIVADAFERQGRLVDALAFWQQAIVIDQTNPTPRLRKARALLALGRTAEGDALLAEITHRRWHEVWTNVVDQASALLATREAPTP